MKASEAGCMKRSEVQKGTTSQTESGYYESCVSMWQRDDAPLQKKCGD